MKSGQCGGKNKYSRRAAYFARVGDENAFKILVQKPEGNRPLRKI
jgi:hypothetical protein